MVSLLLVEDDVSLRQALTKALSKAHYNCRGVGSLEEALKALLEESYDIVLLDLKLPDAEGPQVVKRVKEVSEAKIIVITGYGDIKTAVESIKAGAYDFIQKPFNLDILEADIKRAIKEKLTEEENLTLKELIKKGMDYTFDTKSPKFAEVLSLCERYAKTDTNMLIIGETGTGKEVLARYIHGLSHRREKPFLVVECTSIPPELFESELFGHEKGAFTGASHRKKGLVEMAKGGTLFLDEVGELPQHIQPKLLRFIETKRFRRVGSVKKEFADVRIISATNRDLKALCEKGQFREDLYYRLSILELRLLPLRERREDIPILVNFFLSRWNKKISTEAMEMLKNYPWKGNIRELKNLLERACILADGDFVDDYLFISRENGTFEREL
ncbi:MAG: sigma-54 dependent transcriptional regulator, partial [Hydrogenobacter sp.]